MNKIIVFLILFFNTTFSLSDSNSVSIRTNTDTLKNADTCFVKITNTQNQSWFEKNEGEIFGSFIAAFFAGLIAILSVYLTSRANKNQKQEREKEIYCGLLFAIKIELLYQVQTHKNLIEELKVIEHNSLIANEIIVENPSRNISLTFLNKIRDKVIESEIFNTNILLLLTAYINKCELVNSDINFDRMIKISQKFKDKVNFPASTKSYFSIVIEQINNLQEAIPELIKHINFDLQSLGKTSDIDESKYFQAAS